MKASLSWRLHLVWTYMYLANESKRWQDMFLTREVVKEENLPSFRVDRSRCDSLYTFEYMLHVTWHTFSVHSHMYTVCKWCFLLTMTFFCFGYSLKCPSPLHRLPQSLPRPSSQSTLSSHHTPVSLSRRVSSFDTSWLTDWQEWMSIGFILQFTHALMQGYK